MDNRGNERPQPSQATPQQAGTAPDTTTAFPGETEPSSDAYGVSSFGPAPEFTPEPQQPAASPTKKPKKKLIVAGIIAAILVILLGGGALAYKFWYQNPKKVVSDAVLHTFDATSLTYGGSLDVDGKNGDEAHITFDGSSGDGANKISAEGQFVFNDQEFALGGGLILQADGTVYFKVNRLKALVDGLRDGEDVPAASIKPLDELVAKVDDKWIKAGTGDTKKFSEPVAKAQKCFSEAAKKLQEDSEMRAELFDVYEKHPFVKIEKELGSKDGSLGYEVAIDNALQRDFAKNVEHTKAFKFLHDCDKDITASVGEPGSGQSKDTVKIEVWVSRWKHELTKISTNVTADDGTKMRMTVEPFFNEKTDIKAPEKSMTLEELMAEITKTMQSLMVPAGGAINEGLEGGANSLSS